MSTGLGTQPTATTLDVEQLAKWAWEGRIRIPHFQRPLRWQREDVMKLFDSIARGYPVGSLLLWRRHAPAETLQLGALRIEAPELPNALWVVDGQQRITGLANALHPDGQEDPRFRISYDLRRKIFVPTPRDVEGIVIPLPVIFDLREVLRWFRDHPEAIDHVDEANEITRTIRQFKIPAYEVSEEDPKVLRDIFDRMNNYGKRLTRAEIFSALSPGEESARDRTPALDRIAQNINDDLGFGLIDNDTVLQAVLARRGPDVRRGVRSEFGDEAPVGSSGRHERGRALIDFPNEDRDSVYNRGESAIREAVRFLQDVAGVPHFTLLPYRYLLVVLTRFFAHYSQADDRSVQLIRRWFWRAAVVGPEKFRGSTSGAVRQLNYAIRPSDLDGSISRLLELVPQTSSRRPDLGRFRSNEAATKIVLCSWWSLEPRSLDDGRPFERTDLADCIGEDRAALDAIQYVISRYSVRRERRLWAANRALYPADNKSELGALESLLFPSAQVRTLDSDKLAQALWSHSLSQEMTELLRRGNVDKFLDTRQASLQENLDSFLRRRCEWEFEDTPALDSLVLDDEGEGEELSDDDSSRLF